MATLQDGRRAELNHECEESSICEKVLVILNALEGKNFGRKRSSKKQIEPQKDSHLWNVLHQSGEHTEARCYINQRTARNAR